MTVSPQPFGLPGRVPGDGRTALIALTAPMPTTRPDTTPDEPPITTQPTTTQPATTRTTRSDEHQIRQVYRDHARAVQALASRLLHHDHAAAQDVVQETVQRAWRHPEVLTATPPLLRAWLLKVAKNIVVDRIRAADATRQRETSAAQDPTTAVGEGVAPDHADRVDTALTIADAVASLSADHRGVLEHLYYRGRTTEETAALLGIRPGTVKSRRHNAIQTLRRRLDRGGAR